MIETLTKGLVQGIWKSVRLYPNARGTGVQTSTPQKSIPRDWAAILSRDFARWCLPCCVKRRAREFSWPTPSASTLTVANVESMLAVAFNAPWSGGTFSRL